MSRELKSKKTEGEAVGAPLSVERKNGIRGAEAVIRSAMRLKGSDCNEANIC